MARRDQITGRGPQFGNKRSKALNATAKRWNCNLQNVKVRKSNGTISNLKVSARTKRSLQKKGLIA